MTSMNSMRLTGMMPLGGFRRPPLLEEQYRRRAVYTSTSFPPPPKFPHLSLAVSPPYLPPEMWRKIVEAGIEDADGPPEQAYRYIDSTTPTERTSFLGAVCRISRTLNSIARPLLYKTVKLRNLAELMFMAEAAEADKVVSKAVEELSIAAKEKVSDADEGVMWCKWVGRALGACRNVKSVSISFAGRRFSPIFTFEWLKNGAGAPLSSFEFPLTHVLTML
jgi:hypothetical protein